VLGEPRAAQPPDGLTAQRCVAQVRNGRDPMPADAIAWAAYWLQDEAQADGVAMLAEAYFDRAQSYVLTYRAETRLKASVSRHQWEAVARQVARSFALAFPRHAQAWPLAERATASYEKSGAPVAAAQFLIAFADQDVSPEIGVQAKLHVAEIWAPQRQPWRIRCVSGRMKCLRWAIGCACGA